MVSMSSSSLIDSILARGTMMSCTVTAADVEQVEQDREVLLWQQIRVLQHDGADLLGRHLAIALAAAQA